jgi:hypothetical protein
MAATTRSRSSPAPSTPPRRTSRRCWRRRRRRSPMRATSRVRRSHACAWRSSCGASSRRRRIHAEIERNLAEVDQLVGEILPASHLDRAVTGARADRKRRSPGARGRGGGARRRDGRRHAGRGRGRRDAAASPNPQSSGKRGEARGRTDSHRRDGARGRGVPRRLRPRARYCARGAGASVRAVLPARRPRRIIGRVGARAVARASDRRPPWRAAFHARPALPTAAGSSFVSH